MEGLKSSRGQEAMSVSGKAKRLEDLWIWLEARELVKEVYKWEGEWEGVKP